MEGEGRFGSAYAISGILGWESNFKSLKFRFIWIVVLISGILFASIGFKPIPIILFAQVADGLLLPIIALFLVGIMNDR
ncbi:MAG: divalent metal cation transporter [Chlorobi bacterium]|nr:divalent metal cation transporter [Chlorobiota bacterium]